MTEIALYVEGGGGTTQQKSDLRRGLDGLLKNVKLKAQEKRIGWKLVCCGGRQAAFEAFTNAIKTNPDSINVLLVDSEEAISTLSGDTTADSIARAHLTQRDKWDLGSVPDNRVHLMVQCMETWIVADPDALARFYGQHFEGNHLPTRLNLEEECKKDIYAKLDKATSDRKITKGQYGKIKHASLLLPLVDPAKIASRCPRFKLFLAWLNETIDES